MAWSIFNPDIYKDFRNRFWFESDKWQPITAQVDCDFQELTCEIVSSPPNTADLDCTSEVFTTSWTGSWTPPPLTGNLDCSTELLTCTMSATFISADRTGDITCTGQALTFEAYTGVELTCTGEVLTANWSGDNEEIVNINCIFDNLTCTIGATTQQVDNWVNCIGLPPTCRMQSGLFMDLSSRPLQFLAEQRQEDMDNCVFRDWTFEAYGDASFTSLVLRTERLNLQMYEASEMELTFEDLEIQISAIQGVISNMDCRFLRPTCEFTSVPIDSIDLDFEEPTLEMSGNTPIISSLVTTFRRPTLNIAATTPHSSSMELEFRDWRYVSYVNPSIYLNANMDLTFRPLQAQMIGIKGRTASLTAKFLRWQLEMTASTDGVNTIEITLPEFIAALDTGGLPGSETCETAEDLVFEEVL